MSEREKDQKETYIIPKRHNQNHTLLERLTHLRQTTLASEIIDITKGNLLRLAVILVNLVARIPLNNALRVGDDLAVLDVEALDGLERAVGAFVELRHHGELLLRVYRHARAVEVLHALAVRVEVASVWVAGARVAVR